MIWIKEQLAIHGQTQRELAAAIGLTEVMFSNIITGRRSLKATEASKIRTFFGLTLPEDMPSSIAVVGKVGAGDHIELADNFAKGAGLYHIKRPAWLPPNNIAAAEIEGSSAEPWALSGDIIFWRREAVAVLQEDLGRAVVAELADGTVVLKRLASGGQAGTWSLISINPSHPNLIDVKLKWASRVLAPMAREDVKIIKP